MDVKRKNKKYIEYIGATGQYRKWEKLMRERRETRRRKN